jgi:hypothetical protein
VNWAAISAIGSVLSGLAILLAFLQLGAQRQDRLRQQVGKIGVWEGDTVKAHETPEGRHWTIPVFIRNSSELPVLVNKAAVHCYETVGARVRGRTVSIELGNIPPGLTSQHDVDYVADNATATVKGWVTRVDIFDGAGYG